MKRILILILLGSSLVISFQSCGERFTSYTMIGSPTPPPGATRVADTSKCDAGWALVPANSETGVNEFCLMKFEAQNSEARHNNYIDHQLIDLDLQNPESAPHEPRYSLPATPIATRLRTALPESAFSPDASDARMSWRYITQAEAVQACQRIDAHLVTTAEAKSVSQNLMLNRQNWISGQVGAGCLFGGHLDLDPSGVAPAPFGNSELNADPYQFTNDTAQSAPESPMNGSSPCFVLSTWTSDLNGRPVPPLQVRRNGALSRRTMILSNGEVLWDWSGNSSEWLAETCQANPRGAGGVPGAGYFDYLASDHTYDPAQFAPSYTEWTRGYLQDSESITLGPLVASVPGTQFLNSMNGTGRYFGCRVSGNAAYRGGAAYHGANGGIFHVHMDHTVNFNHNFIGFRCAKAPK